MEINDKIKYVLGLSEPWSLDSVISKLAEASNILLHRYNYDGQQWEEISHCVEKSEDYLKRLSEIHKMVVTKEELFKELSEAKNKVIELEKRINELD